MKFNELENASLAQLRIMAKELDVSDYGRLKKEDLILRIQQVEAEREGVEMRGESLKL